MPKVLLGNAATQPAQNGTNFMPPIYATWNNSGLEAQSQIELPAGKLRHFSWYQNYLASSGNVTKLAIRVNGIESALSVTAPAGALGRFEDMTNEVTVADGDLVTVAMTGSLAVYSSRITSTSVEFEADGDYPVAVFASTALGSTGAVTSTSGTNFVPFGDHGNPYSTEANSVMPLRAPGSVNRLRIIVTSNTKTVDTHVYLRKNGADSALAVTIPAGFVGVIADNSHSVAVTSGDTINLRYDGVGGTGALQWSFAAVRFTGSGKKWDCFARGDTNSWNLENQVRYITLFGEGDYSASAPETERQARVPFNTIATNLRVQIDYGIAGTIPVTFKLRINGQDGDMSVTPPLNTTGWFEDVSNYDQILAGDLVAIRATAGSNTLTGTVRYTMVTLQEGLIINQSLRPGSGTVLIDGQLAVLQSDAKPTPGAGSVTIDGRNPYAAAVWRVWPVTGRVSVDGFAPMLRYSGSASVVTGGITVTGYPAIVNAVVATQQVLLAMGTETPPAKASGEALLAMGEIVPVVKATFESALALGEIIPGVTVSEQALLVLADGERCTSQRCQLWRITRRDGEVFCFTSLDEDYPWGDEIYEACRSLDPSAAEQQSVLGSTGNVELKGILSSDRITEADLYGGFYDDCFVEVWLANFDPQIKEPPKRIAAGWAGNLSHGEQGFTMEVLGPGTRLDQQALVQNVTPMCNWNFGDGRCQYNREAAKLTGTVTKRGTRLTFVASLSGDGAPFIWENGLCRWKTGANIGQECEVKTITFSSGVISLWALPAYVPTVGDTFELLPGCDRSADTCKNVYGQLLNFGGYPDVPGTDAIADTPDAKT